MVNQKPNHPIDQVQQRNATQAQSNRNEDRNDKQDQRDEDRDEKQDQRKADRN